MRRPVKGQYRLPVPFYLSRRRADGSNPNNTPEEEIIAANPIIHRDFLKKIQTINKKMF